MSATIWVILATLYAADGTKHAYRPEVQFPTEQSACAAAEQISREWLAAHKGWAMCETKAP